MIRNVLKLNGTDGSPTNFGSDTTPPVKVVLPATSVNVVVGHFSKTVTKLDMISPSKEGGITLTKRGEE